MCSPIRCSAGCKSPASAAAASISSSAGYPSPEPVHRADSRLVYETVRGPDAVEGVVSYFEKRAPEFPTSVPGGLPDYAAQVSS